MLLPIARPYQEKAIQETFNTWKDYKKLLLCIATGGGKTFIGCSLAKAFMNHGKRVLVLVHREELMQQFVRTFKPFCVTPELIVAERRGIPKSNCYIAMTETIHRRMKKNPHYLSLLGHIDLLIVDEAHFDSHRKSIEVIERENDCHTLALTATPIPSSKKTIMKNDWDKIIYPITLTDLINQKWLCKCQTYSFNGDVSGLEYRAGEFTEKSQLDVFGKPKLYGGLIENINNIIKDKKSLIFNVNVDHSLDITRRLEQSGYTARHLDGKTPKHEREEILKGFRDNKFQFLCNVGVCTTGYDEDTIESVILNRATCSVSLYYQMCGRGARINPDINKYNFTILDMGMNWKRFGTWDADYDWVDAFENPPALTKGNLTKENNNFINCDTCGKVYKRRVDNCSICGSSLKEKKEKERKLKVSKIITAREIKQYKKDTLPDRLKGRLITSLNDGELREYCEHMGTKLGFYKKYKWMYFRGKYTTEPRIEDLI